MEHSPDSKTSDDVFSTASEHAPRSSRVYFPESPVPLRRRPYSGDTPAVHIYQHTAPPLRRGSPLNPHRASVTTDPTPRPRRSPLLVAMDEHLPQSTRSIPTLDEESAHEMSTLSDEYELSHEDTRILQDVQRALKVKAKREARVKATQQTNAEMTLLPSVTVSSRMSKVLEKQALPVFSSPASSVSSPRKPSTSISSDIDFGPSTKRLAQHIPLHPVPSSLDNGLTLDWGEPTAIEEKSDKKWTLSVRRKDKDKMPPLEMMQDQQETTHRERLSKLRTSASSQTIRKATITSDQLQRRYRLIQDTIDHGNTPLNLAMISRWNASQDAIVRQRFEKAEPMTWLKHLTRRSQFPSRWHLTARIMEEFIRAQGSSQPAMEPIPEGHFLQTSAEPSVHDRVLADIARLRPPRDSLELESRRSEDSALSINISGYSNPAVSRSPSVRQQSGYSKNVSWVSPQRQDMSSGTEEQMPPSITGEIVFGKSSIDMSRLGVEADGLRDKVSNGVGNALPKLILPVPEPTTPIESGAEDVAKLSPGTSPRSSLDLLPWNRRFMPSPMARPPMAEDELFKKEEAMRQEYELKAALLEDAMSRNQHIRHVLNRISTSVKDYDAVQRNAMHILGKKYQTLPKDLLESFGHDPAAVTGPTRRLRGWRAVEDIQARLLRQRHVFAEFLSKEYCRASNHGSILDDQITSLLRSLSLLEEQKETLSKKMKEVETTLRGVQAIHREVKDEYNNTLSLTSAVYPELSQAIALEESYKDQYQQFWEFGMDALTFLLDTVTPFWRNYGKTIGEDVRDFLIIPLYRNEFTGEAKRYRITKFPKRSLRHWLGLVLFFLVSILVTILQTRAAISSSLHFRLHLIPYDGIRYTALPFFWVVIFMQWSAVIVEVAIVFMQLGVLVWWLGWVVNLTT